MKPYNGAKAERISNETLPAGGYISCILDAEIENVNYGDHTGQKLRIHFDIVDGPYAHFFDRQFAASTFDDKKWKGVIRLDYPDEGSKYFESAKRRFNNFIYAVEQSNPGYTWNWDEAGLKRMKIGTIFGMKEWEFNGKTGWASVCAALCSIQDIREGNYKVPADKPLKTASAPAVGGSGEYVPVPGDDDLPF